MTNRMERNYQIFEPFDLFWLPFPYFFNIFVVNKYI